MWTRASWEPVHSIAVRVVPISAVGPADASWTAWVAPLGPRPPGALSRSPGRERSVSRSFSASTAALLAGAPAAAEAVGDGEQPGARVRGVLVGRAYQAGVGQGGVAEFQHGGVPEHVAGVLPLTGGRRGRRRGPAGRPSPPRPAPRTRGSPGPPPAASSAQTSRIRASGMPSRRSHATSRACSSCSAA